MQISKIDQEEQFLTVLCGKGFNITKSPKYDEYQWGLASMVYKFFDKKIENGAGKTEIIQNKELAEELHKPYIREDIKGKLHSSFIDNICGADLDDLQLLNKFDKGIRFFLCVFFINIYSKYERVVPLKNKKKVLQLLRLFKNFWMNQAANQTKYG